MPLRAKDRKVRPLKTNGRLVVGLISGTSLDGVDAALLSISGTAGRPKLLLRAFVTLPYPKKVHDRLLAVAGGEPVSSGEISELNFLTGGCFADAALRVCSEGGVALHHLAVIGSHGQTIFHQGQASTSSVASTFQIGEAAVIAERTGVAVVSDFRAADVAAGGHGAPLVPLVDYLLLRSPRRFTVALNIGGIANLTAIPAGAGPNALSGFDTGPGNMVIDELVRRFTGGCEHYDAGGARAATGKVITPLLKTLVRLPFFKRAPPKSAGREEFGREFVDRYFVNSGERPEDLLRTATELTAQTIAQAIGTFVSPEARKGRLVISGGGAHNSYLLQRLSEILSPMEIRLSGEYNLPGDAKEAIAFALLADRTMHGLPGNLPSVTGARRAMVLGKITRAGGGHR